MKLATGIIAMMLGLIVLLQSCTIGAGSSIIGDQAMGDAGGIGMIAGFFLFVGGAFTFGLPLVGAVIFVVAGLLALMGAEHFPDLQVWAIASAILAGMALVGWRSNRTAKRTVVVAGSTKQGE